MYYLQNNVSNDTADSADSWFKLIIWRINSVKQKFLIKFIFFARVLQKIKYGDKTTNNKESKSISSIIILICSNDTQNLPVWA